MKIIRLAVIAALSLAPSLTAAPASAAQDAAFAKLAQCLELLVTDPIEQARVCGDGEAGSARHFLTSPSPPPPAPPVELPCIPPNNAFSILAEIDLPYCDVR